MAFSAVSEESIVYDIPAHFFENFEQLSQQLQQLFEEIETQHTLTRLPAITDAFVDFYQSFSCEKEVFDSLNAAKSGNDPIFEHSINVALLSRMLGDLNHMDSDSLNVLTQGALLHDIGKTLINPDILYKTDRLTKKEFRAIQKHAKLGYDLLRKMGVDQRIAAVALMHHERCDGSGYPMGTDATHLNDFVRIVAICDVYAGMISSRGYRQSCCPFQIIALFEKDGLHKYDTDYTILFLRSMLDTYVGYSVVLNTGEQGIITSVNPYNLSNPIITINGTTVNLATDDNRNILHIV